jgi:DnaJ-class molecular chaperone
MMSRELILCDRCKGDGKIYWDELVDYHKGLYDYHSKECDFCEGKGRVYKITTITYEKMKD